jgi:8-oxo-dGTP pyrophosphatase MutT (NUDIX family)
VEAAHQEDVLDWINSGADLWRREKPATPPKHLVAYFAVLDVASRKLLLVDHRKSGLWLPSGGHVEPGEDPVTTVKREAEEELSLQAVLLDDAPVFLTVTETVGQGTHTDVSLWFAVRASSLEPIAFDAGEFRGVNWFELEALPTARCEPHLARFATKARRQFA